MINEVDLEEQEEKRIKPKKKIRASVVACIAAVSVTLILAIAAMSVYASGAWRVSYFNMKCDLFKRENKSASKGKTVFVGDSITDFCDLEKYYPDITAYNRGISSDTTDGLLARMDESIFDLQPTQIVFLMGINDFHVLERDEKDVVANYHKIFGQIRARLPETRLTVQSVYPVADIQFKDLDAARNEQVISVNKALFALLPQYKAEYVDVYTVLADDDGSFKKAYTDDGLHPNDQGYRLISSVLAPYLAQSN